MKLVKKHRAKANIKDWALPKFEETANILNNIVLDAASEALEYAIEEDTSAYFSPNPRGGEPQLVIAIDLGDERLHLWKVDLLDACDTDFCTKEELASFFESLAAKLKKA